MSVASRSRYLDTFFSGEVKDLKEGVNYDEETLAYITPYAKAKRLAETVSGIMGAKYVIDAAAGIGGNTMGFARSNNIEHVLSYESNRERWVMLHNNLDKFNLREKTTAYNQEFSIGEDLALLDLNDPNIEEKTVVYFDPPWLASNVAIDKDNYILSGIKISNRTLEDWCRYLVHQKKYLAVVFHLPRGYKLVLSGALIDDTSDSKARLIYYTLNKEVTKKLIDQLKVTQAEDPVIIGVEVVGNGKDESSYEKPLGDIPGPLAVKGPKVTLQTFLTPDFPRRKYFKENFNPKAIHLGQRKLHLSEVEFLTRVLKNTQNAKHPGFTLLYVGAAPGIHIPILSEMFPEVNFVLYDPAPFHIKGSSKIKIHQALFTDELVEQYAAVPNLLFVSDIRSTPKAGYAAADDDKADPEFEDEVRKNLSQQQKWVNQLKPQRSLLKFRLPFTSEDEKANTDYFDGIIHFQAYAPPQSAETRLEVGPKPAIIAYNNTKYEQQMFYFNTQYRIQSFQHYNRRYGWSYDTCREFFILKKYLALRGRGDHEIPEYVKKFDTFNSRPEKSITRILAKH